MWRTVYKLEWRILRRDRAALMTLVVFAVFLTLAALSGGHKSSSIEEGINRSSQADQERLTQLRKTLVEITDSKQPLGATDPRNSTWMGTTGATSLAVLPPAPLAPIAIGQRDLRAQAVRISTEVEVTAEHETESSMSGPSRLRTGAFDPSFVFVVLLPLVVIALSFELLSAERERGTLAMLLSQPVSQRHLVLGKAGARATALTVSTLAFAFAGLALAGADFSAPDAWIHALLYAAILVIWALLWFSAAVAVNAWGRSSTSNALVLVGAWLVCVIIIPGLLSATVDTVYPAPSQMELVHQTREAAKDAERKLAGLEGRHDVDPQAGSQRAKVVEVQREIVRRVEPLQAQMRARRKERQSTMSSLRFVSPASVVQLAIEDVAGSGSVRHQRFDDQVGDVHGQFQKYFFSRVEQEGYFTPDDLAAVPRVSFQEEPVQELLVRVLSGLLSLLFMAGVLLAIAWPGLRRVGRLSR